MSGGNRGLFVLDLVGSTLPAGSHGAQEGSPRDAAQRSATGDGPDQRAGGRAAPARAPAR